MTLQKRITIILGTLFLCLFLILNYFINTVFLERFVVLEEQKMEQNFERMRNAFEDNLENSQTMAKDWGQWIDTYRFIGGEGNRDAYISGNLKDASFSTTKKNLIAFADTRGRIFYGKAFDLEKGKEIALPVELESLAGSGAVLAPRERSGRKGIVMLDGRPMFFYSWSILTSEGKGPMRGTVIMGRFFSKSMIGVLSGVTQLPLSLAAANDPQLPDAIKKAASAVSSDFTVSIVRESKTRIRGYMLFRDINGSPAFVLKFDQPRDIYQQGLKSIHYFRLFSIATAVVFLFIMLGVIQSQVIARVARLSKSFGLIAGSADFSVRVPVGGDDELADLSTGINRTLDVLENAHIALRESEEKYRALVETTKTGYLILDNLGRVVDANPEYVRLTGRKSFEEIRGHAVVEWTAPHDFEKNAAEVARCMQIGYVRNMEIDYIDGAGRITKIEINAKVVDTIEGKRILSLCQDITERKRAEERGERQREIQSAVNRVLRKAISCEDEKKLSVLCLSEAERLTGSAFGFINEVNEDGLFDNLAISDPGWEACRMDPEQASVSLKGLNIHGIRGRVFKDGLPLLLNRPASHPDWIAPPEGHPEMTSFLGIPLRHAGRTIGIIALANKAAGYNESDLEAVENIAIAFVEALMRKRAEEKLRASQAHLSNALRIASLGHWEYDIDRDLFTFSDEFYALFRTTAEQMGGYTMSSARYAGLFVHPDDAPLVYEETRKAVESADPDFSRQLEHRIIYADGDTGHIAVRFRIVKDSEGRTVKTIGANQDITERKRAEEALRESDARFRILFEGSPIGVVINRREEILYANRAFAEIHGYDSPSELVGTSFLNLIATAPREKIAGKIRTNPAPDDSAPVGVEIESLKRDGDIFPAYVSVSLIELADGPATVTFVSDMTEYKKIQQEKEALQQQLLQSQKMESIGTLAGGVAHDFNNMLAVILGNAQLAGMNMPKDGQGSDALEEIERAAMRARDLTMKLLTFARKEKLNVRNLPVNGMLEELAALLKRSIPKKIGIKTALMDNPPPVSMDANQMHQVFLNICNNACDAMPNGGALTIGSEKTVIDEMYAEQHIEARPGEYCMVRIGDTGIGMIEDVRKRIFDPFFTTKGAGKGTGLGLSISYGIVKNHGGFIYVYSEPGKGAEFRIYLPCATDTAADTEPEKPREALREGAETVLVVDDEPSVLKLAGRILEKAGYTALLADGGKKAVELYRNRWDEISLVVMDMIMPEMDGSDVYHALKKINPDVRVVLSSGFSVNGQAGALMSEGIQAFIQKPYKMVEFCNTVRHVIDGGQN